MPPKPVTEPGWYRARDGGGLEWVAPPGDPPPEEDRWELVKVELTDAMVEEPLW